MKRPFIRLQCDECGSGGSDMDLCCDYAYAAVCRIPRVISSIESSETIVSRTRTQFGFQVVFQLTHTLILRYLSTA